MPIVGFIFVVTLPVQAETVDLPVCRGGYKPAPLLTLHNITTQWRNPARGPVG